MFSAYVVDQFIAPGASKFKAAGIPDMSTYAKESRFWVANFFLNSALSSTFAPPMNAYAYNFLRRAQYSFSEHQAARDSTFAFLNSTRQSPGRYADALFHWECFLGQAWHGYSILVTAWKGRAFEKDDGSVEQRLNRLYNQMKHVESCIDNNQMKLGATVPVWLESEGLRSESAFLSWEETAAILRDLAKYADVLVNPQTAAAELAKLDA